jgi:hypothetical protein
MAGLFGIPYMTLLLWFFFVLVGFFFGVWRIRGFWFKYVNVKGSKGKKVMVLINTNTGKDYVVGKLYESIIEIKYRKKVKRIMNVKSCLYRSMGIYWIDVNDGEWIPIRPRIGLPVDYDQEVNDNIIIRLITRPTLNKDLLKLLTLVGVGLVFLLCVANLVMVNKMGKQVAALQGIPGMIQQSTNYIIGNYTLLLTNKTVLQPSYTVPNTTTVIK